MSKLPVLIFLLVIFSVSESRRHFFEEDDDVRQLRTLRQIQLENSYKDAISSGGSYEMERYHRINKRGLSSLIDKKNFRTSFVPHVKQELFGPGDNQVEKEEETKTKETDEETGNGEGEDGGSFSGSGRKRSISSRDKNEHKIPTNRKPLHEKQRKHHRPNGQEGRLIQEKRTSFNPPVQIESFGLDGEIISKPTQDTLDNQVYHRREFVVVRPESLDEQSHNNVYKNRFRKVKVPPPPTGDEEDDEYDSVDLRFGK